MKTQVLNSGIAVASVMPFAINYSPVSNALTKRRSRKKRHLAWEQAELISNGLYARYLSEISVHYPTLTPMELRVCALVKAMLPSWEIGQLLGISEKAVENYRVKARKKIGISGGRLASHLATI
jgi:DNA-binding CsgD family transcriptional regulator